MAAYRNVEYRTKIYMHQEFEFSIIESSGIWKETWATPDQLMGLPPLTFST
jgi:hypothetical protein